jgi:hypothetical protein
MIRGTQKRSYKNKKSFIDFSAQMQENEERRRLKSAHISARSPLFLFVPEDKQ